MEQLQTQSQTQTKTFPSNYLITNIYDLPSYEGFPRPDKLLDIHQTLSLITNTIWEELFYLDSGDEWGTFRDTYFSRFFFGEALYEHYLFAFLKKENPEIPFSEYKEILKKHPFRYYYLCEWKLKDEIRTIKKKKISIPPKTSIMILLITRFLEYCLSLHFHYKEEYRREGRYKDADHYECYLCDSLKHFLEKIEWYWGNFWISKHISSLNKKQARL